MLLESLPISFEAISERGELNQRIGILTQQLAEAKALIADLTADSTDAAKYRALIAHRRDLGEWLVAQATNDSGRLVKLLVNAGLGGEDFIPCEFRVNENGKRYRLALESTCYSVEEE